MSGMLFDTGAQKSALISQCRRYRYNLTRTWDPSNRPVCWIMLNPSTADAETDDRTIRTAILNTLEAQAWAPMTTLNVTVADGMVDLWGTITNDEERHGIRVIAENTDGVKSVKDHLVYIEPYTGTVIDAPDGQV